MNNNNWQATIELKDHKNIEDIIELAKKTASVVIVNSDKIIIKYNRDRIFDLQAMMEKLKSLSIQVLKG